VTRSLRIGLFATAASGLAALLLWSVAGLPDFGHYRHAYGRILNESAPSDRHVTNVVASVVFDYRGFDTLGEEFILFAAVMGLALLLREIEERRPHSREEVGSDALRLVGIGFAVALLVLGLYVVAHGYLTPGGGFQGGVVVASAFLLLYLAAGYRGFHVLSPRPGVDFVEGTGAGAYAVVGIASLLVGAAYLHNFGPLGTSGKLASGGSIPFLNVASALEVSAAFVLLYTEFLEELAGVPDS
jgi:multicomponent Na+:H+ antiporter subunit B